ncbi:hypothetical protein [Winogradskyella sp. R77965]|uniref:hypothetical protein n=1 Tax=Winogradskyella sp. R77965 TaxID=3093872 RepID=UPI0037DCEC6F
MKIGLYVLSILCFVLLSCGDDKSTDEVVEEQKTNQEPVITEKAIEKFKYKDYALSSESEDAIAEWENYQELAIQISYLKKADLSFFNGDKEELKEFIMDFKTATPKEFLTNPIKSRTAIIETMLLKLNENLTLDNIEKKDKLLSVKEVLIAFSNLNYQINKKLEYDYYNKIKAE